jgi:micrococcal nuclease
MSAAFEAFFAAPDDQVPNYSDLDGIECIPDLSDVEKAQVVRVIDGDSIEVLLDGEKFEVRYIGINTPEYYSDERDAAIRATVANKNLVAGKTVYLFKDRSDKDKYGRLLRYVLTNDAFINRELVREGFAEAREYPPDTACHELFEKAAQ